MSRNRHKYHQEGILLLVCLLMTGVYLHASPRVQNASWQLSQLKEKLVHAVSEKKSEWKHSSVSPMQGSQNTIIEQWSGGGVVVKVSVVEYPSEAESTEVLQRLASEGGGKIKRQHFGDEGYGWNDRGSIAFREGRLLVYIGAVSTKIDDPTVLTELGEEAKVVKEFAKYVADEIAGFK